MLRRKGFTLVELMVVILIVAILAAIAIPIMRGRIEAAKWAEGKAMMGTIATSIRAYAAGCDKDLAGLDQITLNWETIGLRGGDFDGSYFEEGLFTWTVNYILADDDLTFMVKAALPVGMKTPENGWSLDQNGQWDSGVGL